MANKISPVKKNFRKKLLCELLEELENKLGLKGDKELSELLTSNSPQKGKTSSTSSMFNNWKTGASVGKNAVEKFIDTAAKAFILGSYKVIAELEPIRVSKESLEKKQKEMDFYDTKTNMKSLLESEKGIYIFYDSMGKAIYAGKTERNSLWLEMKNAYNRSRSTQWKYKRTSGTKIYNQPYYLHEVAAYTSVYSVKNYAIGFIEALLIHSFPNDLTNVRIEKNGKIRFDAASTKKRKRTIKKV